MFVAEYNSEVVGTLGISQNSLKKYSHTASFGMVF